MKKLRVTLLKQGPLTKQEAIVLVYLCNGYSRQEIADKPPQRSISTINRQVESIAYKLEAKCQAEIVSTAVALKLVKIEVCPTHSLFAKSLVVLLVGLNVSGGNVDMRRGPVAPRPIRTARTSNRTNRNVGQYSEKHAFGGLIMAKNDRNNQLKHFYLEKA